MAYYGALLMYTIINEPKNKGKHTHNSFLIAWPFHENFPVKKFRNTVRLKQIKPIAAAAIATTHAAIRFFASTRVIINAAIEVKTRRARDLPATSSRPFC